jgi:hypothetical protein
VVGLALAAEALASGPLLLKATKQRDVNVKVWRTIFWTRVGDPLVDIDVPAGQLIEVKDDSEYTDRSVKQSFLNARGVGSATNVGFGAVVPDPNAPGFVTMPVIGSYLVAKVGYDTPVLMPDIASFAAELYVAIDLEAWINSGAAPPPMGSPVPVAGGLVPGLPGVYVGLVPQVWDPVFGVGNPMPFSGMAFEIGVMSVQMNSPSGCPGDADCDGDVDFFDIDAFVAKLGCPGGDPVGCSLGCPWENADVDGNGIVDFFDIDPFVAALGLPCP